MMKLSAALGLSVVTAVLLSTGCAAEPSTDDTDVESDDGSAITAGIAEGSPEAKGVLRVANEKTAAELRDDVGLTASAAKYIVQYRTDDAFTSVAQLDEVPFVGVTTMKRLLAWAKAHGYVPSPSASTCSGAEIAESELEALLDSTTEVVVGGYRIETRSRTCTGSSCEAWREDAGSVAPELREGLVTIAHYDHHAQVQLAPAGGVKARTRVGATFDAAVLGSFLADPSGYSFGGAFKRTCGELTATRTESLGGQRTKQIEVSLKSFTSFAKRDASSTGAGTYFTTPREVTFTCSETDVAWEYTCTGRRASTRQTTGHGTVKVSADGSKLELVDTASILPSVGFWRGEFTFDAAARIDQRSSAGNSTSRTAAVRANDALAIELYYSWHPDGNWCGAAPSTIARCVAVARAE